MPKKYIITDIDGVVLDWEEGFSVWMEHHGHNKVDGYQFVYNIGERYGMPYEQGSKLVKQFNREAEGIETFQNSLKANFNVSSKKYEKILKAALDLGIDIPKKIEQQFKELEEYCFTLGFKMVSSSPLTRSSYHADEDFKKLKEAI